MVRTTVCVATGLITLIAGAAALAQQAGGVEVTVTVRPLAQNVVLPQRRVFIAPPPPERRPTPQPVQIGRVEITGVAAVVRIDRQVATTTLDIALRNPTSQRLEAEVVLPVPETAAVRGFDFQGAGAEPSAQLLRREEARQLYDSIVRQTRDPALLEFIGYNLIRSSVFPVEPGGTQRVRLTYEHVCPIDGDRVDYVLPRTEAIDSTIPWDVRVEIVSERKIATVYSPSHTIDQKPGGPGADGKYVWLKIADGSRTDPGSFRLSYLLEHGALAASVLAYPDAKIGGGYFMLLAGMPADAAKDRPAIRREVTLVLDRSGSMNGPKLEQVREAANQVLAGLDEGELFNVIVYNEAVDAFSDAPVAKTADTIARARAYLDAMTARGGTNIHDALVEALRQKPTDGTLPIVLFLTDGLPTIGERNEKPIRELVTKLNPHHRRVFTFGVGVDVNSPLLENLAYESRAVATFVLPDEDVEVKVGGMFRRLSGPVLADPTLAVFDASGGGGAKAAGRVMDVMPVRLPDLFDGDQLVLLGRYVGDAPLTFQVAGNLRGVAQSQRYDFDPSHATTRHAFVPRIWAARKIGVLIDAIRTSGADPATAANDPKMKELVDEIVRLSTEFGILTEYTAFFAREGTNLNDAPGLARAAQEQLQQRAIAERSGLGSVSQDANSAGRKSADKLNYRNGYWTEHMEQAAQADGVQQVADRSLWKQNGTWVDGKLATRADAQQVQQKPDRTVEFGSTAYFDLARKLAAENRNGVYAIDGDALVEVDGQAVLVKAPANN